MIAKGARKPSSKISGHLELFMRSSFLISRGRNLHILTQAEMIEDFEPLRKDLLGIGVGSYVVELVDAVTYEEGSNVKLYDLLVSTLDSLSTGKDPGIIIRYYTPGQKMNGRNYVSAMISIWYLSQHPGICIPRCQYMLWNTVNTWHRKFLQQEQLMSAGNWLKLLNEPASI